MSDGPDLPRLDLRRGAWRAEVHDPRPDPFALGARYVHGGYVHRLWRGERCLTGMARKQWNAFDGGGLPETFETDLGAAHTSDGDTFLRIGAGRLIRRGGPRRIMHLADLAVHWQLVDRGADWLTMRCEDRIQRVGGLMGYELERTVRLHDDGLESITTLRVLCGWNHPVSWFPHPFWAQESVSQTAYRLPEGAELEGQLTLGDDGLIRLPDAHFAASGLVHGVWGHRGHIDCHLSQPLGGGVVRMETTWPWDHIVVWASRHGSSIEPQLGRIWPRREQRSWSLRYRWVE